MLSYAVVGGSRGIGLEFVRQLSTVFAMLVRDKARSSYLASVVATASNHIHVLQADVVDHDSLMEDVSESRDMTAG
ncbi:hypothetical protein SCP_1602430 [Sparassis crispa]|uniref:Ketoreductase (KR) domain-containing protein n=1 Tax=Sparassis crispa TaxID=139825 RepID=A0A401H5E6_9APHY|nr:hypothetical protein SCP_1602430 [Sparassis crispa]GBE89580.1 hypothetical protein SCP_1602430 [Sparassis crispa]